MQIDFTVVQNDDISNLFSIYSDPTSKGFLSHNLKNSTTIQLANCHERSILIKRNEKRSTFRNMGQTRLSRQATVAL